MFYGYRGRQIAKRELVSWQDQVIRLLKKPGSDDLSGFLVEPLDFVCVYESCAFSSFYFHDVGVTVCIVNDSFNNGSNRSEVIH